MATVTITLGAGGVPNGWTVFVSTRDTQPTFSSGTGDIESLQFTALPHGDVLLHVRALYVTDDIRLDLALNGQSVTGTAVAKGLGKGGGGGEGGAPPGAGGGGAGGGKSGGGGKGGGGES